MGRFLSLAETARECRVSKVTLRRWLLKGLIPGAHQSEKGRWYIPEYGIEAFQKGEAK